MTIKEVFTTTISFLAQGFWLGGAVGLFAGIMLRPLKKIFQG